METVVDEKGGLGGTRGMLDKRATWGWRSIVTIMVLIGIVAAALIVGLRIRRAAWDFTEDVRFHGDVNNAVFWGHEAADSGLFHLYDAVDQGTISEPDRKIDYPPLRLTMAAAWWRWWIHPRFPDATEWESEYEFTEPMLWGNTAAELASSLLVFLLVRLWRVRELGLPSRRVKNPHPNPSLSTWGGERREQGEGNRAGRFFTGVFAGTAGALVFWFNPAIIWNAHCWPQWDVWPIPFFLAAVLLASSDWWMAAGVCLGIGASLKGQLLLAAPGDVGVADRPAAFRGRGRKSRRDFCWRRRWSRACRGCCPAGWDGAGWQCLCGALA